jgi:hypothetical protein
LRPAFRSQLFDIVNSISPKRMGPTLQNGENPRPAGRSWGLGFDFAVDGLCF